MVNTGPAGLALLIYFTLNGAFVGTRLGYCWLMVEEDNPEYKTTKCRDPYPTIADKAFGKIGRYFSTLCIIGVQYGTGVGFLILCAKFADNILHYFDVLTWMTPCRWVDSLNIWNSVSKVQWNRLILFWALVITPICWFGSPHDFWFAAPAALTATAVACVLIMVRESLDVRDEDSCYFPGTEPSENTTTTAQSVISSRKFEPSFPDSIEFLGFGEGCETLCIAKTFLKTSLFSIFSHHVCICWIC